MSRLSPATLIVVVFALLLALAGAGFVRQVLLREAATGPAPQPTLYTVPVASIDLLPGRRIANADLIVMQMTRTEFEKASGDWLPREFVSSPIQLIGRVLKDPLKKGQAIQVVNLYPEGSGPAVSDDLAVGKRAVTISVEGTGFVDGFATPGSLVDVLFRSSKEDLTDIPETTVTVLHAIRVLAVNRNPYPQSTPPDPRNRTLEKVQVTLAVSPVEGNVLKALEGRGEISLALRPEKERTPDEVQKLIAAQSKELDQLTRERDALANLKDLSVTGKVEFTHEDRLTELGKTVPELVATLEELKSELAVIVDGSVANRQTLAQILNLEHERVTVAVASADLQPERLLRAGDFRMMELSLDEAREKGFPTQTTESPDGFVGRTLKVALSRGEPLTADLLYADGTGPGLSNRLPNGFRAVTIGLDRESFVDGYAAPGSTVDVFFRAEPQEGIPDTTLMVLEGIDVLAVDGSVYPFPDARSADKAADDVKVTLAVPVETVGRLKAVEGRGQLTLALRSPDDRSPLVIGRELEAAMEQLQRAEIETEALGRLKKLAGPVGLDQVQEDRLQELKLTMPALEDHVAALQSEQTSSRRDVPQLTLADVLGVQPAELPPPPQTVEVYLGGQRKTIEFPTGASQFFNATSRKAVTQPVLPAPASDSPAAPAPPAADGKSNASPSGGTDQSNKSSAHRPTVIHAPDKASAANANSAVTNHLAAVAPPRPTVIQSVLPVVVEKSNFPVALAESMLQVNLRLSGMVESLEDRLKAAAVDNEKTVEASEKTLKAAEAALASVEKTRVATPGQSVVRTPSAPPLPEAVAVSGRGVSSSYALFLGGSNRDEQNSDWIEENESLSRRAVRPGATEPKRNTGSIELFLGGVRN